MGEKKEVRKVCQDCSQYSRITKMCDNTKYVPRKGTCELWSTEKSTK